MALQHRRGLAKDFDPYKMLPAEFAVSTDTSTGNQIVWVCFQAGNVKRIAMYEDFADWLEAQKDQIYKELKQELTTYFNELKGDLESYIQGKLNDEWIPALQAYVTQAETASKNAQASEKNAKTSETNAKASETNAKNSASSASASATQAANSASNAKTSEVNAKASETASASSASQAKTSEVNAKTSETNAKNSETNALNSEKSANSSQQAAKTSETNALNSANSAKQSETNSALSEENAKKSEQNSALSEKNSKNSEANAKNWELLAESHNHGQTGVREGEDTDNSKYYSEQSKLYADQVREKAQWQWTGDYQSGKSYLKNHLVEYEGSVYIALIDNPKGTPQEDHLNWDLFAYGYYPEDGEREILFYKTISTNDWSGESKNWIAVVEIENVSVDDYVYFYKADNLTKEELRAFDTAELNSLERTEPDKIPIRSLAKEKPSDLKFRIIVRKK